MYFRLHIQIKDELESTREIVEEHIDKEIPSMPPKKVFRSKYSLPELECYKSKPAQESYLDKC